MDNSLKESLEKMHNQQYHIIDMRRPPKPILVISSNYDTANNMKELSKSPVGLDYHIIYYLNNDIEKVEFQLLDISNAEMTPELEELIREYIGSKTTKF